MELAKARFARNPNFIFRKVAEEYILVPIQQNVADMDCLYTINPVGAFIWETLEEPAGLAELQAALLEEYTAEPEVIAADLENFITEMLSCDAIRRV